jgi:hypothetical protein
MFKLFSKLDIKYFLSTFAKKPRSNNKKYIYYRNNDRNNDRYDGYNFHDFMDKLLNEGAF